MASKQIGNDNPDGAVKFRERVYKPSWHGGKGSKPRVNIHSKQYRDNWDAIFGKSNRLGEKENAKKEDND